MATSQLAAPSFNITDPIGSFTAVQAAVNEWAKRQHPAVEVAFATFTSGLQGAALGAGMGFLTAADPKAAAPGPNGAPNPLSAGGPGVQARNFAVITGTQAGLSLAIKKLRKGKDDVQTAMLAALGAGAAFSLVSGMAPAGSNPLTNAAATGLSFAVLQGAFYKIGELMGGNKKNAAEEELHYVRGKGLLQTLGLSTYEKNLKRGQLTDNTIMLWNESALQEVKIPAGPRLLILHHIDQYRHLLKPAGPLPPA